MRGAYIHRGQRECEKYLRKVPNILAAALPPDPAPETVEAMARAQCAEHGLDPDAWLYDSPVSSRRIKQWRMHEKMAGAAYRALRASLLPGEEPR